MPLEFEAERTKKVEGAARQAMAKSGSDAARFVSALYHHGSAEDIAGYAEDDLLAFALRAWEQMQKRKGDAHKLEVINQDLNGGENEATQPVTVIQMLNGNKPFLLDSIMSELTDAAHEIRLVLHPIMALERDGTGVLTAYHGLHFSGSVQLESVIQIHIERIEDEEERRELQDRLDEILNDVQMVVADWRPMLALMKSTIDTYKTNPPPVTVDELAEAIQFLEWLANDNFVFMGMREFSFIGGVEQGELKRIDDPGLGLLSNPDVKVLRRGNEMVTMTPEIREFLLKPEPLIITKANVRSRVHRRVHMDYVGIKTYTETGDLKGELRVVGLFTSTAYTHSVAKIPILRRKVDQVLETAGFDPEGHSGKALINVLEHYPRDELFQLDDETLLRNSLTVLQLDERPRVRVLTRPDKFDRFVSLLIYTPRDRYSTDVRLRLSAHFAEAYQGSISHWTITYLEGTLARLHLIIGRRIGQTPVITQAELEEAVSNIIRTWADALYETLSKAYMPMAARELKKRYHSAFSAAYREAFDAETALYDIQTLEQLREDLATSISFGQRVDQASDQCQLKFYRKAKPIPLSDRVPILENMGFRVVNERTYRIRTEPLDESQESDLFYLHDMTLLSANGAAIDMDTQRELLQGMLGAVWFGKAENDGYNRLTLLANIGWRDVKLLRAISRYLRQGGVTFSQDYLWEAINRYPTIAQKLVDLFHHRFSPDLDEQQRSKGVTATLEAIHVALEDVASLDDDRILRYFLTVLNATVRTNFFQISQEGGVKETLAFKLMPREIDFLAEPRPYREIFVYSPRVEGVHLRFGPVARGGLRWSDRPQDFRTEVLGLVKAQQVKNAVIVPVGAKGGFFPKHLPVGGSREEVFAEGTAAYKIFINSLLDVTDNLKDGGVEPPERVVRLDDDDPYLVVAADKGTATFSDTANGLSDGRNFWLSDAFASGGSAGYDHKKMGITARGAWEAVKRHFREMDHDIQTEPFTVVGVGDMSGDVFGNGMLLSPATKVVAAFDHRDIFIDPTPDPETTYAERKRLFDMGRSSWKDYDTKLLSKGGGVFPRSSKSISLTPEIQKALGLSTKKATPNELMRAILKADVDLLWFGGIGTYARATAETNADADDRGNDAIRITAKEIGAKVIGEGANLGLTQRARIEFCQKGGRCNSDAIDNSAGVNSSDVEVNIKIALGAAVRSGKLDLDARNVLLADMTDQVAELVLRNNYLQTLSISLTQRRGVEDFAFQTRLMQVLEGRNLLDREVEELPDDTELAERKGNDGILSRPEVGVLLAYAKITLFDDLLATDAPDDSYLVQELTEYFPSQMARTYAEEIAGHRLRREIIATVLANSIINRGGATFIVRMADRTGASVNEIAKAYAITRHAFGLRALNDEIDALDTKVAGSVQLDLYLAVQNLLHDRVVWFIRNTDLREGIAEIGDRFKAGIETLHKEQSKNVAEWIGPSIQAQCDTWIAAGVPKALAWKVAMLPIAASIPDTVIVSENCKRKLVDAATTHLAVRRAFRIGWIANSARRLNTSDYYEGLALDRALQTLTSAHRQITTAVMQEAGAKQSGEKAFEAWNAQHASVVDRTKATVEAITESDTLTVAKLAVAAGLLSDLSNSL